MRRFTCERKQFKIYQKDEAKNYQKVVFWYKIKNLKPLGLSFYQGKPI